MACLLIYAYLWEANLKGVVGMMKRYIFHYNGNEKEKHYEQLDYYHRNGDYESLTEHELLSRQNGNICKADLDSALDNGVGKLVEAYFEDGNELDVYVSELEEVTE